MPALSRNQYGGALIIGGDYQGLGIARNLAPLKLPVYVLDHELCIGRFSRHVDHFLKCPPPAREEAFADYLMDIGHRNNFRDWVIYPTTDRAVRILSLERGRLQRHYLVPTPEWRITRLVYDKRLTYETAARIGIPVPETYFPADLGTLKNLKLEYPVILKPSIKDHFFDVTREKALRADNRRELIERYEYMSSIIPPSEIMVQEMILGGPENLYSFCSLFAQGKVKASITAKRPRQHPMDFGSATTYAYTCEIPVLRTHSEKILREIDYYGLSEVEFMYDVRQRTFKLLEINARTWGWHTLGAKAGVNFSLMLFRDLHHEDAQSENYEKGVKWFREITDCCISAKEMLKGRMDFASYRETFRGKKEWAVYSHRDPLPFLVELILSPYFWYKRGRRANGKHTREQSLGRGPAASDRPKVGARF